MNIIQTIAGTRADHGGTSRSVPYLCGELAAIDPGLRVRLVTGKPADIGIECNSPAAPVQTTWVPESRIYRHFGMRIRFEQELIGLIDSDASDSPVVRQTLLHDHGIWLATNRAVAAVARSRKLPRIVSPQGMLSAWSMNHGRLKKRLAWLHYQQADLASATAFHATGQQEADDIRSLGFKQPIAIIPNGIEFPEKMPARAANDGRKNCLFLSRVHPKKGLLNLLHAWEQAGIGDNWQLVIGGPDENGHRAQVENLAKELKLTTQIRFTGPVSDSAKWQLYRDADLFVLPSFSENFGIVVAEALAAGLPVITTTTTPWKSIADRELGWWVEPTATEIRIALQEAIAMPDKALAEMGKRGASWAVNSFCWREIALKMLHFYSWIIDRRENKPDFIS